MDCMTNGYILGATGILYLLLGVVCGIFIGIIFRREK